MFYPLPQFLKIVAQSQAFCQPYPPPIVAILNPPAKRDSRFLFNLGLQLSAKIRVTFVSYHRQHISILVVNSLAIDIYR